MGGSPRFRTPDGSRLHKSLLSIPHPSPPVTPRVTVDPTEDRRGPGVYPWGLLSRPQTGDHKTVGVTDRLRPRVIPRVSGPPVYHLYVGVVNYRTGGTENRKLGTSRCESIEQKLTNLFDKNTESL